LVILAAHKIHNLSDMSRVALVYKFGGLYSDMDVIALRPLVGATNFIALQVPKAKLDRNNCRTYNA
jgi:mannosyltransferase OCH1-like enzyme